MYPSLKSFTSLLFWRKTLKYIGRKKARRRSFKSRMVTHCIFDLDGTILDNQHGLDAAFKIIFEKYGQEYTPEWRLKLMGMTGRAMWEMVIQEFGIKAEWRNLYDAYKKVVKDTLLNASLRPGVERLVNHLHGHCIPIAIATSSRKVSMEQKTKHIDYIISKFSHVVCGGDDPHVKGSKPSPDVYRICALRFLETPEPEECLVFEDSPIGVKAALNACMPVVGIPCPPTPPEALRGADEVISSLDNFKPQKYGLPPFPK